MSKSTADICDEFSDQQIQIAEPIFQSFGTKRQFCGPIATCKAQEDNSFVRTALAEPGEGRVLVVDGGGSTRFALVGEELARVAMQNNWAGMLVNGAIRDSAIVATLDVAIKALTTSPRACENRDIGERDVPLNFAGTIFMPGYYLYADDDGVLIAETALY